MDMELASAKPARRFGKGLDRILTLELVRVTERAAVSAARRRRQRGW